jgi:hypothetical protein
MYPFICRCAYAAGTHFIVHALLPKEKREASISFFTMHDITNFSTYLTLRNFARKKKRFIIPDCKTRRSAHLIAQGNDHSSTVNKDSTTTGDSSMMGTDVTFGDA